MTLRPLRASVAARWMIAAILTAAALQAQTNSNSGQTVQPGNCSAYTGGCPNTAPLPCAYTGSCADQGSNPISLNIPDGIKQLTGQLLQNLVMLWIKSALGMATRASAPGADATVTSSVLYMGQALAQQLRNDDWNLSQQINAITNKWGTNPNMSPQDKSSLESLASQQTQNHVMQGQLLQAYTTLYQYLQTYTIPGSYIQPPWNLQIAYLANGSKPMQH